MPKKTVEERKTKISDRVERLEQMLERTPRWPGLESDPSDLEFGPIDWAYFKVFGEVWITEPDLLHGGGYFSHPTFVFPELELEQGGGYCPDPLKCSIPLGYNNFYNPSFEEWDVDGWPGWLHSGDCTFDVTEVYHGTLSCHYNGIGTIGPYIAQNFEIAGRPYVSVPACLSLLSTFSFFAKASEAGMFLLIQVTTLTGLAEFTYTAEDTDWHEVDILAEVLAQEPEETIISVQVNFNPVGTGKKWWVDYFRLIR